MSSFTTELVVQALDARKWKVKERFNYNIDVADSLNAVEVPVGFITDFASIPRPLWVLLPPWGQYGKAAVIHDFMYTEHKHSTYDAEGVESFVQIERKQADDIFLQAMEVLGVNVITRYAMYAAVRVFGNRPWND